MTVGGHVAVVDSMAVGNNVAIITCFIVVTSIPVIGRGVIRFHYFDSWVLVSSGS